MNSMQKEFDIVVAHLYKQGRPAKDEEGGVGCKYRIQSADEILTCAVGCRIPASRYSPNMEQKGHPRLINAFGHRLRKELTAYAGMFSDLQVAHDLCDVVDGKFDFTDLGRRLERVAQKHVLVFNRPQV